MENLKFKIVNGVKFDCEHTTSVFCNDWRAVSDWWSEHPTAIRITPDFDTENIEEYNKLNHNISFPTEMEFAFPVENN